MFCPSNFGCLPTQERQGNRSAPWFFIYTQIVRACRYSDCDYPNYYSHSDRKLQHSDCYSNCCSISKHHFLLPDTQLLNYCLCCWHKQKPRMFLLQRKQSHNLLTIQLHLHTQRLVQFEIQHFYNLPQYYRQGRMFSNLVG